ncbi:hypothetical protein PMAYCL1PPCAC_16449, partial [Pristionchus mayeri]
TMRLFIFFVLIAIASSLKCYDGVIPWGPASEQPKLTLKECADGVRCCSVVWAMPGTIYSCGNECPKPHAFISGEKCESIQFDMSSCHCAGPAGKCKPTP